MTSRNGRTKPEPRCPLRPQDACSLCQLDVTGPQDCPLVYLVGEDPDLRRSVRPLADGVKDLSGGSVAS